MELSISKYALFLFEELTYKVYICKVNSLIMEKLVSIIVPCYNQGNYLNDSLQSVLNQTHASWECIIVDDGSTDETKDIASKWVEKDSRFKYIYKANEGLCTARNSGIKIATGDYILPLDADDKISENYIKLALLEFEKNNNLKVVYCNALKFGQINEKWKLPDYSLDNLAISNMIFCSAVYKKSDWERIGGYDVAMVYGLEDWEFWISMLKNGGEVKKIEEVGFFYRTKEDSMVTNLNDELANKMYDYMSVKHADFFVKHLGSFKILISTIQKNNKNLNNTKFLINLVFKKVVGFNLFSKNK